MRKRRPIIVQRTPIFFGCEGESEQGYAQLLNDLLRAANIPVHLEVVNLNPGAGDPIARLRKAELEIARRSRRRSEFAGKLILMDQVDGNAQRRQQAEQLAHQLGVRIIWQEPCHEAFLLRHLDGFEQNRPPTTQVAVNALRAAWPEYGKPMTKILLSRRIGILEVRRAAGVEALIAAFLREIKLIP